MGIDYDTSADMWSFACMMFELITGDFMFEPRKGPTYGKTDDHLAQMMELLGPMPMNFAVSGKNFDNFFHFDEFTGKQTFKKIQGLKHFPMRKLLLEKYRLKSNEAEMLADFLMKMIQWYPSDRATAQQMLDHPWFSMPDDFNYRMSDLEYKKFKLRQTIENVNDDFLTQDPNLPRTKKTNY